jgi:acetyl esterase/lipase
MLFRDLSHLRSRRTGRSSSWDKTGRNADRYIIPPGESIVLVDSPGPADLTHPFPVEIKELIHNVFGPEQLASGSPVQYAHPEAPPFFIVHGDADPVVPVEQAHLLYNALVTAGAPVEKLIVHNANHGLEPVGGAMSPSAKEMFAMIPTFLATHLEK